MLRSIVYKSEGKDGEVNIDINKLGLTQKLKRKTFVY